ncbi:MAG: hypothetical protein AAGI37_20345 [Planctomycetota bacterium]
MALSICYLEAPNSVADWTKKCLYIDQEFYELLYTYFSEISVNSKLRDMVTISYDQELVIDWDDLKDTLDDLNRIKEKRAIMHPQVDLLSKVLNQAIARKSKLAVSGDMYPDLSQRK